MKNKNLLKQIKKYDQKYTLSIFVKDILEECQISIKQFAKKLKYPKTKLLKIINEEFVFEFCDVKRIALELKVSVNFLLKLNIEAFLRINKFEKNIVVLDDNGKNLKKLKSNEAIHFVRTKEEIRELKSALMACGWTPDIHSKEHHAEDSDLEKVINAFLTRTFIFSKNVPSDECLEETKKITKLLKTKNMSRIAIKKKIKLLLNESFQPNENSKYFDTDLCANKIMVIYAGLYEKQ